MENLIFSVLDAEGKLVCLTRERLKHILRDHPELHGQIEDLKDIISKPQITRTSIKDITAKFYYRYYKDRKYDKYLAVLVKYLNGEGFIITAFYASNITGI